MAKCVSLLNKRNNIPAKIRKYPFYFNTCRNYLIWRAFTYASILIKCIACFINKHNTLSSSLYVNVLYAFLQYYSQNSTQFYNIKILSRESIIFIIQFPPHYGPHDTIKWQLTVYYWCCAKRFHGKRKKNIFLLKASIIFQSEISIV